MTPKEANKVRKRLLASYLKHTLARMAETREATAHLRQLEELLTEDEGDALLQAHHRTVTTWDDKVLEQACAELVLKWDSEVNDGETT